MSDKEKLSDSDVKIAKIVSKQTVLVALITAIAGVVTGYLAKTPASGSVAKKEIIQSQDVSEEEWGNLEAYAGTALMEAKSGRTSDALTLEEFNMIAKDFFRMQEGTTDNYFHYKIENAFVGKGLRWVDREGLAYDIALAFNAERKQILISYGGSNGLPDISGLIGFLEEETGYVLIHL